MNILKKMKYKVSDLKLVDSVNAFYSLNFHSIWQYFKENNWKYSFTPADRTPNIHELKDVVLRLLLDIEDMVFKHGLPSGEDGDYTVSTGRFKVTIDDVGIIEISLIITDSEHM